MLTLLLALLVPFAPHADVVYLTDVEGSEVKLQTFFERSDAFSFDAEGEAHLRQNYTFVYGGDAPDRYFGSMRILRTLRRIKRESPLRTHFIAGNREVKNLRFRVELSPEAIAKPPFWTFFTNEDAWLAEANAKSSPLQRMKFMLANNLGCPNVFEFRRKEFDGATDEQVYQSLIREVEPGGDLLELMKVMQLAVRIGNTLFVHGGLTAANAGIVPGAQRRLGDVNHWIKALNNWYHARLSLFDGSVHWSGLGPRPGEDLLEYPMPATQQTSKPESVITGRHVDSDNNILLPTANVVSWLTSQGIARVVVGHTPAGDVPVRARTANGDFEIIVADNTFSAREDNPAWLHLSGNNLNVAESHGLIQFGSEWKLIQARTVVGEPSPFGGRLNNGAHVVGVDRDDHMVATQMRKFKIENQLVPEGALISFDKPGPDHTLFTSGPIGYYPGSFDPPTEAHREIALLALEKFKLRKLFVVANIFGPKDYEASVVERVDMLKLMFKGFEDRIEIRGEPFAGKEQFFITLKQRGADPIYNIVGTDGYNALPPAVQAQQDREWVIIPRGAGTSERAPIQLPGELRSVSSSDVREALRRPGAKVAGIYPEVLAHIRAHGLYQAPEDPAALERDYRALYADFQMEVRRRLPTLVLGQFIAPPFKAEVSRGGWLEKFILWTIRQNNLEGPAVAQFSDSARAIFANKGWDQRFPIVKLKAGVPSSRCLQYLLGDPTIR